MYVYFYVTYHVCAYVRMYVREVCPFCPMCVAASQETGLQTGGGVRCLQGGVDGATRGLPEAVTVSCVTVNALSVCAQIQVCFTTQCVLLVNFIFHPKIHVNTVESVLQTTCPKCSLLNHPIRTVIADLPIHFYMYEDYLSIEISFP